MDLDVTLLTFDTALIVSIYKFWSTNFIFFVQLNIFISKAIKIVKKQILKISGILNESMYDLIVWNCSKQSQIYRLIVPHSSILSQYKKYLSIYKLIANNWTTTIDWKILRYSINVRHVYFWTHYHTAR